MTSTTGTLDLSGLSLMLEQTIEAAVEKAAEKAVKKAVEKAAQEAVAEAMANNREGAISVLLEPLSNQNTTLVPGGDPPTTVQHNQSTCIEKRLPSEVWEQIFKYLYPSQLSRVSMVCQTFSDIIANLSLWPEIYARAHLNNQNHAVGCFKPVPGKNPIKDFMLYICAESLQICELRLSVHKDFDVPRDRLASFPLPVHVWRVRLASKKTGNFQPLSATIGPQDWVVRLCLGCRRKVSEQCPESESTYIQIVYFDSEDLEAYNLTVRDVGLGADERTVLAVARGKYGGDIGIQAGRQWSSNDAIKSMESRLKVICLRLTIAAADG